VVEVSLALRSHDGQHDKDDRFKQKKLNKFSKDAFHIISCLLKGLVIFFCENETNPERLCEENIRIFLGFLNTRIQKQVRCTMIDIEARDTAAASHLPACFSHNWAAERWIDGERLKIHPNQ